MERTHGLLGADLRPGVIRPYDPFGWLVARMGHFWGYLPSIRPASAAPS